MRIKVIDGFRAIAVMGVLWAHTWGFYGGQSWTFAHVDVAKLISFFGTGVDLFFVISGFCMYLMYSSKKAGMTGRYYLQYLGRRWLRIAPAFYAAIIIYGLSNVSFNVYSFDKIYALQNMLFIRTLFKETTQYASHFWSLCTEWHFYMVLPLILIGMKKWSFSTIIVITIIISFGFRVIAWRENNDPLNIINYFILNRLIEFVVGIIVAWLYINKKALRVSNNIYGLLIGILIACAGRILITGQFANRPDSLGIIARVFNLPLLTTGYGMVILNTLRYQSVFSRILESNVMTLIGKYSYSMYLWHWIVSENIARGFKSISTLHPFFQTNVVFICSLVLLFPLSKLSYTLFESIYFNRKGVQKLIKPAPGLYRRL